MSASTPSGPAGRRRHALGDLRAAEELILEAVRGIRYGSVEITIHDSQVVQIERREKLRTGFETLPPR